MMDGKTCVAIIYYIIIDKQNPEKEGTGQFRFQLSDNLGSTSLEIDMDAQLISYEEYFPYGGTAIIAGNNQAEVKLKVYRNSGKERDDSMAQGITLHGLDGGLNLIRPVLSTGRICMLLLGGTLLTM